MTKTIIPTIHLNGNSKEKLLEYYNNAYNAVDEAIGVFQEIDFHKRDYYPQGDEAWDAAVEAHQEARNNLLQTRLYLKKIIFGIEGYPIDEI